MAGFAFVDTNIFLFASLGLFCIVIMFGCMWCQKKWKKFREWRIRSQTNNESPSQRNNDFSIFPPPSVSQLSSVNSASGAILDEIVFEPLPEIRSRNLQAVAQNVHPARFTGSGRKVSLQDWFDEHQANFPRNQLKYLREVGSAWYGQAVEGEAYSILPNEEKTLVTVKILRVDAAPSEYMQFLNEARPFRDLRNPFLLRLIGQCLEVHPFLLIMEHCEMDLKTCLIQQRRSPEILLKDSVMLRMACNVASAIQYMHEHGFIHCDVAAHSCVIAKEFVVKVGDYGTSLHTHKSDYYCLGDIAFPLRWCAPEALYCTESIVESKDITREANVWSFGVFLWELLEFCKLPYMDLSDEEVVQKVVIESSVRLEQPKTPCVHKDMMFKIMELCWLPPSQRPSMQRVLTLLYYLYENKDVVTESAAFEARWNALQPSVHSHNLAQHISSTQLKFETDFSTKHDQALAKDCDSIMSNDLSNHYSDKSPSRGSLSTGYEVGFANDISPSLQNLRGSFEDLISGHVSGNEELDCYEHKKSYFINSDDHEIQRTITEAIKDLDMVLADEPTSTESSVSNSSGKQISDVLPIIEKVDVNSAIVNCECMTNVEDGSEVIEEALPCIVKQNGNIVRQITPDSISVTTPSSHSFE